MTMISADADPVAVLARQAATGLALRAPIECVLVSGQFQPVDLMEMR